MIALTASPDKAVEWGVDETRVLPFAESAIDVDKPADLELAERILRNSASYQPAIM